MAEVAVALDVASGRDALALVERIGEAISWYKLGPVLYVREGPGLARELLARGKQVFLDLKWHDIPSTVAGAVAAAADLGVSLATVHLSGGPRMLESAARARQAGLRIVGVGVLTSMDGPEFGTVVARAVDDVTLEQERLVRLGLEAGLDGFVCAAAEAARLREIAGRQAWLVTPGIRRAGDGASDQRRTASPLEAARAGATLLVVGRPVTGAEDPKAVARAIREEAASG